MRKHLKAQGYKIMTDQRSTLVYKAVRPDLREIIPLTGPIGELSSLRGRGPLRMIEPDLVVRPLRHGGVFRKLTGRNFISPARSYRELAISTYLRKNSVLTPEIMAIRHVRSGLFYHITVISQMVPDSIDLLEFLETRGNDFSAIFFDVGSLVRSVHYLDVFHADLHIKNILLDAKMKPWILDLDKARRLPYLPQAARQLNTRRFFRSCRKWQAKDRISLPADWQAQFIQGYKQQP